jgi:hypothetical protein
VPSRLSSLSDLGYDPYLTMSVPIPVHDNSHISWQDRSQYFEQIRAKIAAMPQVTSHRCTKPLIAS